MTKQKYRVYHITRDEELCFQFLRFYAFSRNSYLKTNNCYIKQDQKSENYAFLEHKSYIFLTMVMKLV